MFKKISSFSGLLCFLASAQTIAATPEIDQRERQRLETQGYVEESYANATEQFALCHALNDEASTEDILYFVKRNESNIATSEILFSSKESTTFINNQEQQNFSDFKSRVEHLKEDKESWSCHNNLSSKQIRYSIPTASEPRKGLSKSDQNTSIITEYDLNNQMRTYHESNGMEFFDASEHGWVGYLYDFDYQKKKYDSLGREFQLHFYDGYSSNSRCTFYEEGEERITESYRGEVDCIEKEAEYRYNLINDNNEMCGAHSQNACIENGDLTCLEECLVDYNWPDGETFNCWCPADYR